MIKNRIDIHIHLFKHKSLAHTGDTQGFMQPDELFELCDRIGISKSVILPIVSPEHMNSVQGNEEVYELIRSYPDRLDWFCNIDPRNGSNSACSDLVKNINAYKSLGAKGIGEITANLAIDDPMVYNLFSSALKTNMPVLIHIATGCRGGYGLVDEMGLPGLEKALRAFPGLMFIGHSQPFWSEISSDVTKDQRNGYPKGKVIPGRIVQLMRQYNNLYADISAGSGFNALARDPGFGYSFLEEFQDRIFFGTDICAPGEIICLYKYLDDAMKDKNISEDVYNKICFQNAQRYLGIEA